MVCFARFLRMFVVPANEGKVAWRFNTVGLVGLTSVFLGKLNGFTSIFNLKPNLEYPGIDSDFLGVSGFFGCSGWAGGFSKTIYVI